MPAGADLVLHSEHLPTGRLIEESPPNDKRRAAGAVIDIVCGYNEALLQAHAIHEHSGEWLTDLYSDFGLLTEDETAIAAEEVRLAARSWDKLIQKRVMERWIHSIQAGEYGGDKLIMKRVMERWIHSMQWLYYYSSSDSD